MLRAAWGGLADASSWAEALVIRHQPLVLVILALALVGIMYRESQGRDGLTTLGRIPIGTI